MHWREGGSFTAQENRIDHAASAAALKRGFLSGLRVKSVQGTGKSGKPLTFKGHFFPRHGEMVAVERIRL